MSEAQPLAGKAAIITGAGRGIGAAAAALFASQGARVLATDVMDLGAAADGERIKFLRHDVADPAAWSRVVAYAEETFGRLDVLVNNAGIFRAGDLQGTSASTMEDVFRVNQLGVFLGMSSTIDLFGRSGGGAIVNMSSCVAMRGVPGQFAYSASKWAVRGMTRCAALDLAPLRIRVNSVHPGPTDTPMMSEFSTELRSMIQSMMPWGRLVTAEEIANAIAFLASDAAAYINGAELEVDGGVFA
jgi:3alpha(or 20beta)-hydroxysteroid dehydrogenase